MKNYIRGSVGIIIMTIVVLIVAAGATYYWTTRYAARNVDGIMSTSTTTEQLVPKEAAKIPMGSSKTITEAVLNSTLPLAVDGLKFTKGKAVTWYDDGKTGGVMTAISTLSSVKEVDLNQDGKQDAVAILSSWIEGSYGSANEELVGFVNDGKELRYVGGFDYERFTGDRHQQIIITPHADGRVTINELAQPPVNITVKLLNGKFEVIR